MRSKLTITHKVITRLYQIFLENFMEYGDFARMEQIPHSHKVIIFFDLCSLYVVVG